MLIQKEKLQVGEILSSCWGYDQTNWDFYQIVKISDKSIWIKELQHKIKECGYMTYEVTPVKDKFVENSKTIRKTIQDYIKLNSYQYLQHHDFTNSVLETKYY